MRLLRFVLPVVFVAAGACSSGGTDAFASCAEAKAAGHQALKKGEAGYSKKLDRDGDGVACDQ